jgi:uncharacterized protein YcbK (DUF882 family)
VPKKAAICARTVTGALGAMWLAGALTVASAAPGAGPEPAERRIALYNIHTKETLNVVYKRHGRYVPTAMREIDRMLRDWRRDATIRMDPALVDLLWEMHTELGSSAPMHVVSGYRSPATNEMLRRTVGGQARGSQHTRGKAVDVHFPDVPIERLRYSALVRERGGVGYYPTSALPFVHVDTGNVRHWPRLPRHELALLFPKGVTRHRAADGGAIDADDVAEAKRKHRSLATRVAEFHELRKTPLGQRPTLVAVADLSGVRGQGGSAQRIAALAPPPLVDPLPRLLHGPRPAIRPTLPRPAAVARAQPTDADRVQLARLAMAAGPSLGTLLAGPRPATRPEPPRPLPVLERTAPAPAWDEEHPEELAYRPFPILPLLTSSASPDDPVLVDRFAIDSRRTLGLMEHEGTSLALRFRPTPQVAKQMWSQQFTGAAVAIGRWQVEEGSAAGDDRSALRR